MRRIALIALSVLMPIAGHALDEYPDALKTSDGGLICASPFELKEAGQAIRSSDFKWLKSLGCVVPQADLSAIKISTELEIEGIRIWKVRLKPQTGEAITIYGYPFSFVAENGDRLNEYGRRLTSDR